MSSRRSYLYVLFFLLSGVLLWAEEPAVSADENSRAETPNLYSETHRKRSLTLKVSHHPYTPAANLEDSALADKSSTVKSTTGKSTIKKNTLDTRLWVTRFLFRLDSDAHLNAAHPIQDYLTPTEVRLHQVIQTPESQSGNTQSPVKENWQLLGVHYPDPITRPLRAKNSTRENDITPNASPAATLNAGIEVRLYEGPPFEIIGFSQTSMGNVGTTDNANNVGNANDANNGNNDNNDNNSENTNIARNERPPVYTLTYQLCSETFCYPPEKIETKTYPALPTEALDRLIGTSPLPPALTDIFLTAQSTKEISTKSSTETVFENPPTLAPPPRSGLTLSLALLFALLGGVLLNFMPCVLPVVYLKIYALMQVLSESAPPSKEDLTHDKNIPAPETPLASSTPTESAQLLQLAAVKRSLVEFGIGVYLVFFILAVVAAALQASGEAIGWGFQFQNPLYVLTLIALTWFLGLTLLGAFTLPELGGLTFGLSPYDAPPSEEKQNAEETPKTALKKTLSTKHIQLGMLTALLATPCTAPLLGPALGLLFSRSWWELILAVQMSGLGLALPYWALALYPNLAKTLMEKLPAPGPWMGHLQKIFGFILIAIGLWLLHILYALGAFAVVGEALLYLWGGSLILIFTHGAKATLTVRRLGRLGFITLTLLLFAVIFTRPAPDHSNANSLNSQNLQNVSPATARYIAEISADLDYPVQPLTAQTLREAKRANRLQYIHITAKWCLSCQVNRKLVLEQTRTLDLFREHNVLVLVGDWTMENDFILSYLQANSRAGIPFDAVSHSDKPPIILSEVLTFKAIKQALEGDGL